MFLSLLLDRSLSDDRVFINFGGFGFLSSPGFSLFSLECFDFVDFVDYFSSSDFSSC